MNPVAANAIRPNAVRAPAVIPALAFVQPAVVAAAPAAPANKGRPRKYKTEEERQNALKQYQREYKNRYYAQHREECQQKKRDLYARKKIQQIGEGIVERVNEWIR